MSQTLLKEDKARTHIKSPFTRESLVDKGVMASTAIERETDLLPYVIMIGMPPYHYWEQPPRKGNLPMNGSDFGLYIFAEALGARSLTFIKDVDGLYSEDPRTNPRASFIPKISASELLALDLERSCIDRMVAEVMVRSRHVKKIQIINGLKPGNLTRALNLEQVGTIIYKQESSHREL